MIPLTYEFLYVVDPASNYQSVFLDTVSPTAKVAQPWGVVIGELPLGSL